MRILITGANGYLGSQLVNELAIDHEIIGTVRTGSSCERLNSPERVVLVNINEGDFLKRIDEFSPDVVINTVASYGRKNEKITQLVESNILFPSIILDKILKLKNKVFINCGTSLPMNVSLYALTKKQFSQLGELSSRDSDCKFINLQLEHFFGPFDDESKFTSYVINSCKNDIDLNLTSGVQERDFIYINDLISAFQCILKNLDQLKHYENIEIGSGKTVKIRELVEIIAKMTNYKGRLNFGIIPIRRNELMYSCADLTRMNQLGWFPHYSIESAIQETINE